MIEILSTGAANSVQDLGRFGYLDVGVGRSGAMDGLALELGNILVGNPPQAAGLEITIFPFRMTFAVPTVLSVTGAACPTRLNDRTYPSSWVLQAEAGDTLHLGLPTDGARAYLCFRGGIDVPLVLGSRATDLKSGWGGFEGRGLKRGDRLALHPDQHGLAKTLPAGFGLDTGMLRAPVAAANAGADVTVRVLPSAEYAAFTDSARQDFFGSDWTLSNDANRQGYRLEGPSLALTARLELFSHGIMPGTVQVPPSGQPIIQLAEANTCGGYPKIANIIEVDLWRLAQMPVGATIRFVETTRDQAVLALRAQKRLLADLAETTALVSGRHNPAGRSGEQA